MKSLTAFFAMIIAFVFVGAFAFAQATGIELPTDPTSVGDVITALSALIGGASGATTLAIAALVAQFLSKFVLSPLWDSLKLDPKYKFLVFGISQIALVIVPLMVQGKTFMEALSAGGTLLLVVQFGYRVYELFFEKKDA